MELIAALVLLYALACGVWVPGGAHLFFAGPGGWRVSSGPGFRLLHPRPAARTWLALRFPLVWQRGRLRGWRGATWLSDRADPEGPACDREALRGAELHGTVVRLAGRPFARGFDAPDAERIAALLRDLGANDAGYARRRIAAELARSHSLAELRAARARFDEAAWWLGWTSDAYFVALFALLPGAMWATGNDYAIRLLVPALILLHGVTCVALARSHRRLWPARRSERIQLLLGAALYPPGLLRAYVQLRTAALASFAPATVAAEVLPRETAKGFLRAELVRAARRETASDSDSADAELDLPGLEEQALRALVLELGEEPHALLAAPPPNDPLALGYCPACRSEYRRAAGSCTDCDVPLAAYPTRAATSD